MRTGFRTFRAVARLAAPAVLGACLVAGVSAQSTLFPVEHAYDTVFGPFGCAAADLDGDGAVDVVVANYAASRLTVYQGGGDGSLQLPTPLFVGSAPRGVTIADFDADGIPDLAVACSGIDSVTVLLGQGNLAFGAPASHAVDQFPVWVQAADLDGDGNLDLACASQGGENLSVLLGDGLGGFAPASFYPLGKSAEQLALGDLDGDGDPDAVVSSWLDSRLIVMRNDGSGAFALTASIIATSPKGIALHDMDADGKLDAVITDTTTHRVSLHRGNGLGGFVAPKHFTVGNYPVAVQVGDFTSDGRPDLVTANGGASTLDVLVNVGGGEFHRAVSSPASFSPTYLTTADLDGDGRTDVVLTDFGQKRVSTHLAADFGTWVRYCTGKLNSQNCRPKISASGAPSASNLYPFRVRTDLLVAHTNGIYIYKLNAPQAPIPFQGGSLCLGAGGVRRTPGFGSGGETGCEGSFQLDFNAFAAGLAGGNPDAGLKIPGASYLVQAWARDPGSSPFPTGLSDALDVQIGP